MRRKKEAQAAILLALAVNLSFTPAHAQVSQITDSSISVPRFGIKTKLLSSPRIVALANGSMEVLFALGLEKYVVGRDVASSFRGVQRIPVVTNGHSISPEKLLKLKPTLLLINKNSGPAKALALIRNSGVKISVIPDAFSVGDMKAKYQAILEAVNLSPNSNEARSLISGIPNETSITTNPAIKVAFLYLRGASSIYLMGGKGSGADNLITAAGGIDVGKELGYPAFSPITSEAVIRSNPSIFLVMIKGLDSVGGSQGLQRLPGISQTKAGRFGNIVAVDDSLLLSFGPRTSLLVQNLTQVFASFAEQNV